MPHADLKYSPDLSFDPQAMFEAIKQTILAYDSGSGDCKCRSYPAEAGNHTHLLIEISMLSKPHRDAGFTRAQRDTIAAAVKKQLQQSYYISLAVIYSDAMYLTDRHEI
ncbi:hypothetical protein OAH73_00675 [Planktomarina sp.]|nr:hypothetical protein [Planktomarina sp.]MDB4841086.1 hypothetical protein [Planktomarina sp.]